MIDVKDHPEGATVPVRAKPGAKSDGIAGEHGGALKVSVTAPALEGRANEALARVLADRLGVRPSRVALVSGPTSKDKRFLIEGVTADELRSKLETLLATPDAR